MPVIGYLNEGALEPGTYFLAEFRKGLSDAGYFEGRNVAIEYIVPPSGRPHLVPTRIREQGR